MSSQVDSMHFSSHDQLFQVSLSAKAISEIVSFCRSSVGVETGGILIGNYSQDNRTALVTEATGPPVDSVRGFARFVRGIIGLQEMLNKLWLGQSRKYYLGEWHFHPMAVPDPSGQDINQMRKIACDTRYACPEPILVILSGCPTNKWQLNVSVQPSRTDTVYLHLVATC